MAKEMKKKSPFLLNACFITPYPFYRFGFAAYRYGRRWFYAAAT